MSDNPFAMPPEPGNQGFSLDVGKSTPQSAPGALMVILIFCLILGILGLLGTCATGAVIGMQSTFEKMIMEGPGPIEQKEFQRLNMAVSKKAMMPGLILAGVNLIIATMLVVGSIGALRGKETGRSLLSTALLAAIVYSVLKIIVTIYSYFVTMSGLQAAVDNYQGEADPAMLAQQMQFGKIGGIVGAVFGVVIALAILVFYLWARGYINKDKVVSYFASRSR